MSKKFCLGLFRLLSFKSFTSTLIVVLQFQILQVEATWVRTHIKNRDMIKYFYMQSLAVKFDVKNKFLKDSDSDFGPARSFGNEQNL